MLYGHNNTNTTGVNSGVETKKSHDNKEFHAAGLKQLVNGIHSRG